MRSFAISLLFESQLFRNVALPMVLFEAYRNPAAPSPGLSCRAVFSGVFVSSFLCFPNSSVCVVHDQMIVLISFEMSALLLCMSVLRLRTCCVSVCARACVCMDAGDISLNSQGLFPGRFL